MNNFLKNLVKNIQTAGDKEGLTEQQAKKRRNKHLDDVYSYTVKFLYWLSVIFIFWIIYLLIIYSAHLSQDPQEIKTTLESI